jgi:hypothetical protein
MVLSGVDIRRYIAEGRIRISPEFRKKARSKYACQTRPLANRLAGEFKG